MSSTLIITIIVVCVVAAALVAWHLTRKPKLQPTTPVTANVSESNLDNILASLSSESFEFMSSPPPPSSSGSDSSYSKSEMRRDRASADILLKDHTKLQKPLIADLVSRAKLAMDMLVPPANQNLCYPNPANVDEVLQNIGSVIYTAMQAQTNLSDPTYINSVAALMLVRYSLVAASEDKRDLITVVKDTNNNIVSVVLRPKMMRLLANMIDRIFDRYYELSPSMKAFVDNVQPTLEQQFGISMEDVKATTKEGRKDAAKTAQKKQSIMSAANRTIPISTFAATMVLLASNEVVQKCEAPSEDVVL